MGAINFILAVIFSIIGLIAVTLVIIRVIGNNKKWKETEPQLIRDIEKSVGQKIVYKTMQNASHSMEFCEGKGFWLWMAFTADYAAFIIRDEIAEKGEGHIFISQRKDTSIMRLKKYYAELEVKSRDTSEEALKLILLVREPQYEALTRFIPAKPYSKSE